MEIYLDHAATSRSKPPEVAGSMLAFMETNNTNPGRSGYALSLEAGRMVRGVREEIAAFFGAPAPESVVFTLNVTMALNMVLAGMAEPGDHFILSSLEHNAVYRPIEALREAGTISVSVLPCDSRGLTDPDDLVSGIRPNTKALVVSHASNVCGAIFPLAEAARIARERGVAVVVDAAQTAGVLPLSMQDADVLAFTGHKHLLGPTGTGGFVLGEGMAKKIRPLLRGGTGSLSHEARQPDFLPDKFESGTLNTVGLAGLGAAIAWLRARDPAKDRASEQERTRQLLDGLAALPGVAVAGPRDPRYQTGTVAFNIRSVDNGELAHVLDREFSVLGRSGLHCAPLAHRSLGTWPGGAMRLSLGLSTTAEEIRVALEALERIVVSLRGA